ncbi:L,D-transpeptidase family protein [Methyloversatilis sp.]|uniref:L,D-transpeptidase family protein n=1 Tax=Methyloversatilis sp. TaxID=2569862 RepID=UPI003F726CF7
MEAIHSTVPSLKSALDAVKIAQSQRHRITMRRLFCLLLALSTPYVFAQADRVRVLKSERKLQILAGDTVLHEFGIALGGHPLGHKQQEGDQRTPEGRYTLDYRKPDSAYYKALHVSYPEARDVEQAKAAGVSPGGLIMIHGQRNGFGWLAPLTQRFDWTDGCIGLRNEDMDIVWQIVGNGTPIDLLP